MSEIEFDIDERTANELIKANPDAFNSGDPLAVIHARSSISDAMLDARVNALVSYGVFKTEEEAEKHVLAYLKGTIK